MNTVIRGDIPIVSTNIAASIQMSNFSKEVASRANRVESTKDSGNVNVKLQQDQKYRRANNIDSKLRKLPYGNNVPDGSGFTIDYII